MCFLSNKMTGYLPAFGITTSCHCELFYRHCSPHCHCERVQRARQSIKFKELFYFLWIATPTLSARNDTNWKLCLMQREFKTQCNKKREFKLLAWDWKLNFKSHSSSFFSFTKVSKMWILDTFLISINFKTCFNRHLKMTDIWIYGYFARLSMTIKDIRRPACHCE